MSGSRSKALIRRKDHGKPLNKEARRRSSIAPDADDASVVTRSANGTSPVHTSTRTRSRKRHHLASPDFVAPEYDKA